MYHVGIYHGDKLVVVIRVSAEKLLDTLCEITAQGFTPIVKSA